MSIDFSLFILFKVLCRFLFIIVSDGFALTIQHVKVAIFLSDGFALTIQHVKVAIFTFK
jgi:hypothetical protein